jgi:hypothetical protein
VRRVRRMLLLTDLHLSHPAAYPDVPPNAVDPKHHRRLTEQDRIAAVCCLMDPFNWEKELQVCVRSFDHTRRLPHALLLLLASGQLLLFWRIPNVQS